jgi:hypothetical protein
MSNALIDADAQYSRLANRYADAINRADFDDLAMCWAPNGTWQVPAPFSILQSGREQIQAHLTERRQTVHIVVMTVCTVLALEATEDRIVGRVTIEETGRRDAERGIHVFGLYDDELIKIDGQWHFLNRTLNLLAVDNSPTVYTASPSEL